MEPTEFMIAGYRVRHDGGYNWIVERPVTRKKRGTEEAYLDYEILSYHAELKAACKRLYQEELRGKGQQNMKDMADLILQMEDKLEKAVTAALAGAA